MEVEQKDTTIATIGHILGAFTSVWAPLILFLIVKHDNKDEFTVESLKEALNFQITIALAGLISGILSFVLIGIPMMFVVIIADIVYSIIAALETQKGNLYRYPFTLRLIK